MEKKGRISFFCKERGVFLVNCFGIILYHTAIVYIGRKAMWITGLGQDSHQFDTKEKPCRLGGITIPDVLGLKAESDGDVVLHAICNAITSVTHVPILGKVAIELCQQGITDSAVYLQHALRSMQQCTIEHVAISIEAKQPKLQPHINTMRQSIASLLQINLDAVGITATSGDYCTAFGEGKGIQVFVIVSFLRKDV